MMSRNCFRVLFLFLLLGQCEEVRASSYADLVKALESEYSQYQDEIKDLTIEGSLTSDGSSMLTVRSDATGYRIDNRISTSAGPMVVSIIHKGEEVWTIHPAVGKYSTPQAQGAQPWAYERAWWAHVASAKFEKEQRIGFAKTAVLRLAPGEFPPFDRFWIDLRSHLLVQAEAHTPDGRAVMLRYDDFQPLGRWRYPRTIRIQSTGQPVSVWKAAKVQANVGMPPKFLDAQQSSAEETRSIVDSDGRVFVVPADGQVSIEKGAADEGPTAGPVQSALIDRSDKA